MDAVTDYHEPLRLELGAYLLGALDPADRSAVAAHLADCPACRNELAELAGLPGLLGQLTVEEAAATLDVAGEPGQRVLDAALTGMTRARRQQRRRWLAGAAVAVLLAAGAATAGTIAATASVTASATAPTGVTVTAADPTTHVQAIATLRGGPAGTVIGLRLAGVAPGLHCELIAVGTDGHREVAGTWRAAYTGDVSVTGTTAIPQDELAALQVVTTDGAPLVTLPAPR